MDRAINLYETRSSHFYRATSCKHCMFVGNSVCISVLLFVYYIALCWTAKRRSIGLISKLSSRPGIYTILFFRANYCGEILTLSGRSRPVVICLIAIWRSQVQISPPKVAYHNSHCVIKLWVRAMHPQKLRHDGTWRRPSFLTAIIVGWHYCAGCRGLHFSSVLYCTEPECEGMTCMKMWW